MSDATAPRPPATEVQQQRIEWAVVVQTATALALFVLPLLFPLGIGRDYPNHLARVFIQNHLDGNALLAANYALEHFIVPDLAMDLLSRPLSGFLDPYQIGALFNGATLVLLFTAVLALHRWHSGRAEIWPCLAAAVLFNAALLWGFMNFLFAAGLALWLFYAWLRTENWPLVPRLVLFSVAQTGLFFAHLLGLLFLGLLVLTWELARLWRGPGGVTGTGLALFVLRMLQFAIPLGLFAYVVLGQEGVGSSETSYGGLSAKASVLLSPTAALGDIFGPLILINLLFFCYWLLRKRHAKFMQPMIPVLLAVTALVIAMPNMILGIWGLDFRFPFLLLLLTIASTQMVSTGSIRRLADGACLILVVSTLALAGLAMRDTDWMQQQIRAAAATMKPGSALLVAGDYDPACYSCRSGWANIFHAGSLAAIERQAFVPMLFTATSFVKASEARRPLDVPYGLPVPKQALADGLNRPLPPASDTHDPARPYWHSWPEHFDYVLWLRSSGESLGEFEQLYPVIESEDFTLYRVERPAR